MSSTARSQDFVDKNKETNEAAQAALKRLDSIVGLKPVKEFEAQGRSHQKLQDIIRYQILTLKR